MSSVGGRDTAFAAAFAQNQPQEVGRNHRNRTEKTTYTAHRATLAKNAESGVKRMDTRRRNTMLRTTASESQPHPPNSATSMAMSQPPSTPRPSTTSSPHPAPGAVPQPAQSTPRPLQQLAQSTTRLLQLAQPMPSPVLPVRGFATSTPSRLPLQPLQNVSKAQYPNFHDGAHPAVLRTSLSSETLAPPPDMSPEAIANMLRMIESAGYFTLPPVVGEPLHDPLPVGNLHLPNLAGNGDDGSGSQDGFGNGDYGDSQDGLGDWNGGGDYPNPSRDVPSPREEGEDRAEDEREDDTPSDDNSGGHHNAQSSLQVQMHDVEVHRQNQRRPRPVSPASSEAEQDEQRPTRRRKAISTAPTTKPKRKRSQTSRSITAVDAHRQPMVKAAYPRMQERIVTISAFPVDSPSGMPGADDDEFGNMVLDSWDDAHEDLSGIPYLGPPTTPEKNLVRARAPTTRLAFKDAAKLLVMNAYGLIDIQSLTSPDAGKILETIEANRDIYEKTENTYYYLNPLDATIPGSMYRHPIIQNIFNVACFGAHGNRRAHYFAHMAEIPLVTLALIIAAVKCALDEWKTGRRVDKSFDFDPYATIYNDALTHLQGWVAWSAKQPVNLVSRLLTEMLRIARETSTTAPVTNTVAEPSRTFSVGAYAANQPSAA
ncbi:hypothetical protein C8R44DRAFT_885897 [Mycena epipterygia]|nr:hypothetical protein C8R44DRAFT_885897 [Mycena epipterygia]